MALPDLDSAVGHSFGLDIDGNVMNSVIEISGLKLEQDVIEHKHNTMDGKYVIKKLPGRPKPGECTVTVGLTANKGLHDWHKKSAEGHMGSARKGIAVLIYDYEGSVIKTIKLIGGWVKSWEVGGALKAGDTSVLTEKISIVFEGIEVE
jgi:phage tail-like protein